jgi:hypothetical protein
VWYKDPAGTPRSRENDFEAPPGERGRRPATDEGPRAVERIDGGKLRATCATWDDAVVIYPARRWHLGRRAASADKATFVAACRRASCFHETRSEIAHNLVELAGAVAPGGCRAQRPRHRRQPDHQR